MEEIAYDIPQHYPLPPKNVEWGEVGVLTHTLSFLYHSEDIMLSLAAHPNH